MSSKSHFFRQKLLTGSPLYLGGVGSFFTNELLLSQNLSVSESDILNFQIDSNNNISCFVVGDYTIGNMEASNIGNILTYVIGGDNLKSLSSTCFLGQTNLVFFKADNLENPLLRRWFWDTNIEESYLPEVVLFGSQSSTYAYRFNVSLKNVYIPLATQLGSSQSSSAFVDRFFEGAVNLENIYVNPFLMTNNGGLPDADLTRATQLYGTNIIPVTDLTPPQTITDLSISNITTNSFDVNFTPPTSINGILRYDVYVVNDSENKLQEFRKYQSINNSGDTITGLQSGVNYKVRIQTKNNFFTNSEISSEANTSTL